MYNILQAHIEYKDKKLHKVTVLAEISPGDVRALCSTDCLRNGYDSLNPDEPVNEALMQRVAGFGHTLDIKERDKTFPGWRSNYKHNNY